MKQKGRLLALAAAMSLAAAQGAWAAGWQEGNPLIAHALGEADGKIETNSKEAFLSSWENGFRVVEGDFIYTADDALVLRHDFDADGSYYRLEIEPQDGLVMNREDFLENKAVFTQTPMMAVDILQLMQEYTDMYLVTDTKAADEETVRRQFSDLKRIAENSGAPEVLERIIPQIYHKEMLTWVRESYPYQNIIFTLYQLEEPDYADIAAFCAENGIDTVTLHYNRAEKEVIDLFHEKGVRVYVHTVNRYLMLKDLLERGADGIYTDRIKPYELPWVGLENSRKITEQTITLAEKQLTLPTLDIMGETYAPLRRLAEAGKGFSAAYDMEENILHLTIGKKLTTLGNELLLDNSGRLVTKKAQFSLYADGTDTGLSCYLVDGEVYAPLTPMLALVQK